MHIGARIREIRKRKKLTISQVAEGTGLSKGFLSNVENDKTSPSVDTLHTIAKFLRVPLSYLFLEEHERMRIVRKEERQITTFGKNQIKVELLASYDGLRMMIGELPPGVSTGDEAHAHQGKECHVVLKGKILAQQGEDTCILEEGDSFSWNACVPHRVTNISDETARVLITVYTENDPKNNF
ncbi:cupin domain-containing protein [Thermoflavimicrobium dichotomicum]|uniref:Transcriptional regulator, contains XRE-family HTH domain n=1 Tax=Thermoflavimicrobium dichotomicum TaxID=46223 RepID=A0A1I3UW73_9BACL|nr:cupin domain-containing protein [Thermoflavimicrobium dichotomicum]SFJ86336.1 Transcriptional regulator, contains XRE-family HTH domain [Thermoflavimicrobium dichotomicum]